MISTRTSLLQVKTDSGWRYVFCWSPERGRIETTENFKRGIRAEHRAYFESRAGNAEFRVVTPVQVAAEVSTAVPAQA